MRSRLLLGEGIRNDLKGSNPAGLSDAQAFAYAEIIQKGSSQIIHTHSMRSHAPWVASSPTAPRNDGRGRAPRNDGIFHAPWVASSPSAPRNDGVYYQS